MVLAHFGDRQERAISDGRREGGRAPTRRRPDRASAMMVTRHALAGRRFLRGPGSALALPLLDAMVPALTALSKTAAQPVRRLGVVYLPNGMNMWKWRPGGEGDRLELTPILEPLAEFRDQ